MNEFALHPGAIADLDELWEYIAEDNIDAADRVIADIFDAIRNLLHLPHQGHHRQDLTARPLRFVRVHDYLISYAPDEKPLWVIAIPHGRRDPRIMATILGGRESIGLDQTTGTLRES